MDVTLTGYEMLHAAQAGSMRRVEAIKRGRNHRFGTPAAGLWQTDIEAAGAELAFAKATGYYWQSLARNPKELPGDVAKYQVRSTPRADGCLIVHKKDPDDATFFLVTGEIPTFRIVGSIAGGAAKQQRWWRTDTGRPAFFVPQDALWPFEELRVAA